MFGSVAFVFFLMIVLKLNWEKMAQYLGTCLQLFAREKAELCEQECYDGPISLT